MIRCNSSFNKLQQTSIWNVTSVSEISIHKIEFCEQFQYSWTHRKLLGFLCRHVHHSSLTVFKSLVVLICYVLGEHILLAPTDWKEERKS
jgi:hypothetical protein